MSQSKTSFYIIGGGRAGASLAYYFARLGFPITALVERNPERIRFLKKEMNWSFLTSEITAAQISDSRIILLAVHDDHIPEVAQMLSDFTNNWQGKTVVHTSGALSSLVLKPLKKQDAQTAGIHPIYSFSLDPRENHSLKDVWFSMEGDDEALKIFESIFEQTENRAFKVTVEQKKAIHIASVFYANFYVSLAEISGEILNEAIPASGDVFKLLNPLLFSSIEQVTQHGTLQGLTGPLKRGDLQTIGAHLKYLQSKHPDLLSYYTLLTRKLLPLSELRPNEQNAIQALLKKFSG